MPIIRFQPLEPPNLDPRNEEELVSYACDRVYQASSGQINDFSPSSPVVALIEGQAFAQSEFLFFANKFSERVMVQFLQVAGVMERLGSAASVTLTFALTAPLASPFVVPRGYLCSSSSGNLGFITDEALIIPSGSTSGQVSATAEAIGSTYNLPAFSITNLSQPLAYLQSVVNEQSASGGTNAESMDELRSRAFAALRRRGLVSRNDYEEEAIALLGAGSVARAIGNLGADKISKVPGTVHVFVLNPDATELNQAQLNDTQSHLQSQSHLSVQVYVSNVDLYRIQVKAIAKLVSGQNPELAANDIFTAINDYLTPGQLPLGETLILKEIEYLVRNVTGVEYVQSVAMGAAEVGDENLASTNLVLPHLYSAALLNSLTVELVGASGSYVYLYGEGDPD